MTSVDGSDTPMAAAATCASCGDVIGTEAAFCETCGTAVGRAGVDTASAIPTAPPSTAAVPTARPAGAGAACLACGGTVLADGFCDTCGNRAPTVRDHWTESPSSWVGGVCDKGIVHSRNEDALALSAGAEPGSFAALVVCDGVTSAPDSDQASIAAARAARDRLAADAADLIGGGHEGHGGPATRVSAWSVAIEAACALAQRATAAVAASLGSPTDPPACTFAAAVVDQDVVMVGWCGDSRVYWLGDDGDARQLSRDHSLGTEMIAAGIDPAVAEADPDSHTITRWLGADSTTPTPEIVSMPIDRPGWLLVCSDGLWNYASGAPRLLELVRAAQTDGAESPTAVAESLAAFANNSGGHDNISVALARIGSVDRKDM